MFNCCVDVAEVRLLLRVLVQFAKGFACSQSESQYVFKYSFSLRSSIVGNLSQDVEVRRKSDESKVEVDRKCEFQARNRGLS